LSVITHKLELAVGADLTINSNGWMFTDYSSYGLRDVTVRFGKTDEASTTQPAQFSGVVKNTDSRFSFLPRGTPIRYSINPGTGYTQVFQGNVDEVKPDWPAGNSQYAEVAITASGSLQRLTQGSPVTQSAIYRSTVRAPGLVKYVPMEEASGASAMQTLGFKPQNAIFGGTVQFAGDNTLGGSQTAAVLNASSYLGIAVNPRPFAGHWQVDWFMKFTGSDPVAETSIMRCWTNNNSAQVVDVVYGAGGWGYRVYAAHMSLTSSAIFTIPVGLSSGWWHWRIMAHDSGAGNTDYSLVVFPVAGGLGSAGPLTIATVPGNLTSANVLPNAALNGVAMCHWAIYDAWSFSAVDNSADGYAGEDPVTRLKRLCIEESIEVSVTGTSTVTMGPQKPGPILDLLRACEAADGGILCDGYTAGLTYLAESSRYNRAPTLALDTVKAQIKLPFEPTKNDQGLINDWSLTTPAGDAARYSDEVNVAANGRYTSSATVNLADAGQLLDLASWKTRLGTVDELRVPQLKLELIDRPELWTSAFALRPGHAVTADNLLTQFPPGQLGVVAEGVQATIDAASWQATVNCSPSSPFVTGVMDTDWLDCGASVAGSAMTTASTTVDVLVSDECDWSHADGNFNVTLSTPGLADEVMTVTAVSATTATTPALVAVGTQDSSDGSTGPTVTPGLPGGATAAGNLLLMFSSCRDTNAVDTDMYVTGASGWRKIVDGVNFVFFAKVHSGSETAPTVHHSSLITGDTMIAQIASFSGKWGDPASQLVAVAQQLSAAAQDIAYPELPITLGNVLLIWAGWKADDWTSVATLGGITEISEATSTAGNDAGQVWDYNTSAGVPVVGGGSFVVTGGTSQISRGCVFALRSQYQTFTVTRGVNGITRAHALGETVKVTSPLVLSRQ
jgi:hypothetical protein